MTFKISKPHKDVFNNNIDDMLLDGNQIMYKLYKYKSITLVLPEDTLAPNEHKYYETYVSLGSIALPLVLPRVFYEMGDADFIQQPGFFQPVVDLNKTPQKVITPGMISNKYQLVWMFLKHNMLFLAATRDNYSNSDDITFPAQTFNYKGLIFLPSLD